MVEGESESQVGRRERWLLLLKGSGWTAPPLGGTSRRAQQTRCSSLERVCRGTERSAQYLIETVNSLLPSSVHREARGRLEREGMGEVERHNKRSVVCCSLNPSVYGLAEQLLTCSLLSSELRW